MTMRVSGDASPSKALHLGLWVVQGLLGAMFLAIGAMKATQPIPVLANTLGWPAAVPAPLVRFHTLLTGAESDARRPLRQAGRRA